MDDAGRAELIDDSHFRRIIAEYRERLSGGEAIDDDAFVAAHPEYADALRSWIATSSRPDLPGLASAVESVHSTSYQPLSNQDTIPPDPGTRRRTVEPISEQFGRYRIIRCLGQGAMGAVYLAHDAQLDREVAIKIPKFSASDGPEMIQRFYREARSAATLRHANVCPVYDVGEIDGTHYLSMAYIEGHPLSDTIKRDPRIPESRAVEIVLKLARAVAAAHAEGVIHRDLKPANIMIDEHGEPVIMDFGLARRLNCDDARLTQSGLVVGSPAYMSPEQVEGDLDVMGAGCDIYSLGVIFYELLTGEIPFKGSIAAVMGQIVTQAPRRPATIRPGIDPRLEAICLKMMAKKVSDRFSSMLDVVAALSNYKTAGQADFAGGSLEFTHQGRNATAWQDSGRGVSAPAVDAHGARIVLRPWMVWTAVVVVVAGFGVTWWLVALAIEMGNRSASTGVSAGAQKLIKEEGYSLHLDGAQIPEQEFNAPIELAPGAHILEIRQGTEVKSTYEYEVPIGQKFRLNVQENNGEFNVGQKVLTDAPDPPAAEPTEPTGDNLRKSAEITAPAESAAP